MAGAAAAGVALAFAPRVPAAAQGGETEWDFIDLRPGVWRSRRNRHFGLVVEGDAGVAVFDPVGDAEFARWIDARIAERIGKPVTHVIYSHNHSDHAAGGEAFAGHDPIYMSHRLAAESLARMQVPTPPPTLTFDEGFSIALGGRRIDLRYHGPNDGRGSISLLLPDQGVLSVIDWLVIDRMPFRDLARYEVDGAIRSLRDLESMDWTIAAPGHGVTGDKAGARVLLRYLEAVRDGVVEAVVAGKDATATVASLRPQLAATPDFAKLSQFDNWVELNIRGIHHQIARIEGHQDG